MLGETLALLRFPYFGETMANTGFLIMAAALATYRRQGIVSRHRGGRYLVQAPRCSALPHLAPGSDDYQSYDCNCHGSAGL
jgi:hypothetical protein